MGLVEIIVSEDGARIDAFLAKNMNGITRAFAAQLIEQNNVTCNGKNVQKSYKVKNGDALQIDVPKPSELDVAAQDIKLNIMYEDEDLIVVNKEKGMVVHPAQGNFEGTLVNALLHHCKGELSAINGVLRPGIVHRIDKDTSGLIVCAKNNNAHNFLAQQFANHTIKRRYEAIVYGNFKDDSGFVEGNIARHKNNRKSMAMCEKGGKYSYTSYEVIGNYKNFSHIAAVLKTGRTHQIRVHLASINHPLAGDALYGPKKVVKHLNGQCLHARTLGFIHPKTNEDMLFESDLPDYFVSFLNKLAKDSE